MDEFNRNQDELREENSAPFTGGGDANEAFAAPCGENLPKAENVNCAETETKKEEVMQETPAAEPQPQSTEAQTGAQWQPQNTQETAHQAPGPMYDTGYRPPYAPPHSPEFGAQPPYTGNGPVFNASGEYRYVPPYNGAGAYGEASRAPHAPHVTVQPAVEKQKKEKKNKRSFSAGAVAIIVAACVLLSFGAGMCGALLVNTVNGGSSNGGSGDSMVVYKNPQGDSSQAVDSDELSVSDICEKVAASVVEIETEFKNAYGFFQYVNGGAGSGVIITDDGYIITNNHVIYDSSNNKAADTVTVRLSDGNEYKAEIVGRDADSDIALLKISPKEALSAAVVGDSGSLRVGETVIAVGNPLGELGGTVTKGIVSATNREISVDSVKMNLIQIDAAINPGNSGGGMFNMKGELVGIVNAKSTGSDIDGLGFAIPVNDAMSVVEELQNHGYVTGKTYIGVSLVDVTDAYTAYYYFRSQQTGVYIAQVEEGFNDGVLKYGDRIIAINGEEVTSSEDVKEKVKECSVGDKLTFTLSREGKTAEVQVTCYEYTPDEDVSFTD